MGLLRPRGFAEAPICSSGSFAEHGVQNGLPSMSQVAELRDLDALEVI